MTNKIWLAIFGLWLIFISGIPSGLTGSPGLIQLISLKGLLNAKEQQVIQLKDEVTRLEVQSTLLEKSHIAQRREIRRTLGYAAPDELIFDFSVTP
ncbi:MAG: hypothetical protein AABZ06_03050 [Bdellovibrionota bacterium]